MEEKITAQIGIIGGSGFYSFFEEAGTNVQEVTIDTPYGKPSDPITIGEIFGIRHGRIFCGRIHLRRERG